MLCVPEPIASVWFMLALLLPMTCACRVFTNKLYTYMPEPDVV